MPEFSTDTTSFITELDAAVAAHMDWSRKILRCAVLHTHPGEDVLAPLAHELCKFGRWFIKNRAQFELIDAPNTQRLESIHQSMHSAIRVICSDIIDKNPGSAIVLETFEQTQSELIQLLADYKTHYLANSARQDPLTGLPLRYGIESEFRQMQQLCARADLSLYVMMIDIDHFKKINDTYGHLIGDAALSHMANTLKHCKRDSDPLYRFGGEEFLLLLADKSSDGIAIASQRLIDAVRGSPVPLPDGEEIKLTVTLGVSKVDGEEDLAEVIERADKALYRGKHGGRDCYVIAEDQSFL
ncbi:MAG: diguanylate cyclase [Methylotenera sp.]|nr:diguanylate cyclase [Methylotenera sp.]